MEGCYWEKRISYFMASTPIPCVAFQPMSFKKLQTVTIMRIEFLDTRPISDGIKVVLKSRLKIANEIASVITYLHTALPRPIIHRDIHPGHFYLDQDLRAKLSDFICSMALPEGKTQVENEVACGTLGYLGPEDDQKKDYPMDPIQSYVRNQGINGIVDPKILAEGGGVYHHHRFQAVFQLGLKCRK
ncbi:Non-functional pseudokinase ZED1 [Vitis vinifera]|uniref:Non-functional pseudokinase ZED1 n=1 Tax=Vitis vinifera TaxID=29760 RepID=A0A438D7S0_VITVI|nr:Non-functional pseudokinase ZED1 [Vitis vinifera]